MAGVPAEYRPDLTDAEIFAEHTWLQGAFLATVAYGMQTLLYFMLTHKLMTARKGLNTRRNIGLVVYITTMWILGTLYVAGLLEFTQQCFIDGRNIPGGPNAYENEMFSIPIDMLANVIMVLITWMCDIINVWRCYVVYLGGRVPAWAVIAIPAGMYLCSVALGILFLKQVGAPAQSPWDANGINFTIPYYTMSLALNIIVTILIATRLVYYRNRITNIMGTLHGHQYMSLAAIVVESAAIYSAFSLAFLIPFAVSSAVAQLFLQALSPIQIVSTLLIIFRVAQGKVWTAETFTQTVTTLDAPMKNSKGPHNTARRGPSAIRIQTNTSIFTETQRGDESMQLDKIPTRGSASDFEERAVMTKNEAIV